jgi:hypothetical protein
MRPSVRRGRRTLGTFIAVCIAVIVIWAIDKMINGKNDPK